MHRKYWKKHTKVLMISSVKIRMLLIFLSKFFCFKNKTSYFGGKMEMFYILILVEITAVYNCQNSSNRMFKSCIPLC